MVHTTRPHGKKKTNSVYQNIFRRYKIFNILQNKILTEYFCILTLHFKLTPVSWIISNSPFMFNGENLWVSKIVRKESIATVQ